MWTSRYNATRGARVRGSRGRIAWAAAGKRGDLDRRSGALPLYGGIDGGALRPRHLPNGWPRGVCTPFATVRPFAITVCAAHSRAFVSPSTPLPPTAEWLGAEGPVRYVDG